MVNDKDNDIQYEYKPFIGSSHTFAFKNIFSKDKATTILDIGSSIGMIGRVLKAKGFKNLEAVEIDKESREIASKYYNVMYESLDDVTKTYDLILLLDVLEHTVSPREFFEQVLSKLNKGGTLLLSVPNIAHWYPRFSLLFGFFNYKEKGILDKTHLHFFTSKTIRDFVLSFDNVKIIKEQASSAPIEMFLNKRIVKFALYKAFSFLKLWLVNLFPGILGYQNLLVIQKEK